MNPLTKSHKKSFFLENFNLKLGEEYSRETAVSSNSLYEIKNNNTFKVLKLTRS